MKKKNILIIEDDMIHAMVLKTYIEGGGYNVLGTVSYGRDAIETAINKNPDLIISDIMIKGDISGIEVMEQIQIALDIPYIFLTAINNIDLSNSGTLPSAIINKPYDIKYLMETIDTLLNTQ